jgi:hypothetical protein
MADRCDSGVIQVRLDAEPPAGLGAKHVRGASFRKVAGIALAIVILAGGLVASMAIVTTLSSSAAVASTQHSHPNRGVSGVTYLCGPIAGYSCTPGYTGSNASGWAAADYGCPNYASGCGAGTPHNCTLYAAFMLMRNGYGNPHWSENANDWAVAASQHGVSVDQTPRVGSIAQWNAGVGHVAYVETADASGITLTMDDYYTSSPWPNGYTAEVHIAPGSPAWPDNFIHFADQSPSPTSTASSTTGSSHVVLVVNAPSGVYWRSTTSWTTPITQSGSGVYNGDLVELICWQRGATNTPPYDNNPLWYQAAVVQGRGHGQGWVNDHFLNTGSNVPNIPVSGVPQCSTAPPSAAPPASASVQPTNTSQSQPASPQVPSSPVTSGTNSSSSSSNSGGTSAPSTGSSAGSATATTSAAPTTTSAPAAPTPVPAPPPAAAATFIETTGGVTNTWTDYQDAGGTHGPSIPSNQTVQIACKVTGFAVVDGNTWWYRIASSPWGGAYYASADAFYNNGETSGSLHGTPFVDPAVPNC